MSDDNQLFFEAMADVKPLKNTATADNVIEQQQFKQTEAQIAKKLAADEDELLTLMTIDPAMITPVKSDDVIEYKIDGVQAEVFKQLKQGAYDCKTIVELQGLSLSHARQALLNQIYQAEYLGERNLLVIHGKGRNNKPFPALLKSAVAQWLSCLPQVQAYHSATSQLGGSGALFVMLTKSKQKRIDNSELNRKGHGFR
ncbi:DNA endonuclease SmrA [Shewanella sp. WXL01]|nr:MULTISPECIES: DNA endonuclease SmrA [Shewanella]NKF52591.1 DNA endonuclease SmrA [Shewanella sp. WXL01]